MKKLIVFLLSLFLLTNVYAYENDYFSIDIPDGFNENINENNFLFSKDKELISVIVTKNKDNYDINKFKEEDIEKQKEYIINKYKEEVQVLPIINSMQIIYQDKLNYLQYDLIIETNKSIGHDMHIINRMYTTDNYVYLISYKSDKEITQDNIKVLDSIIIKDSYLRNINVYVYLGLLLFVIIVFIFLFNIKGH